MAETIQQLKIRIEVTGLVTGDHGAQQPINYVREYVFSDGTGTNQAESVIWRAARPLNATNEDIDLNGSSTWTDLNGANSAMVQMGMLLVENLDTDTGDTLTVTRPAANGVTGMFAAASDAITVQPGGLLLWIAPGPDKATVTAGTADLINVAAADNSTYNLLIVGDKT